MPIFDKSRNHAVISGYFHGAHFLQDGWYYDQNGKPVDVPGHKPPPAPTQVNTKDARVADIARLVNEGLTLEQAVARVTANVPAARSIAPAVSASPAVDNADKGEDASQPVEKKPLKAGAPDFYAWGWQDLRKNFAAENGRQPVNKAEAIKFFETEWAEAA